MVYFKFNIKIAVFPILKFIANYPFKNYPNDRLCSVFLSFLFKTELGYLWCWFYSKVQKPPFSAKNVPSDLATHHSRYHFLVFLCIRFRAFKMPHCALRGKECPCRIFAKKWL